MAHPAPLVAPQPALADALNKLLGTDLLAHVFTVDEDSITVERDAIAGVMIALRDNLEYQQMMEIAGVDYPDRAERFEVVYEFYSIRKRHRIRLKARVPESDCIVDSLTDLWKGADFMEREVYDMMGIRFRRHPDLRRILMPDDYTEGYPLRKDFPVRGKGWRDTFEFLDETR